MREKAVKNDIKGARQKEEENKKTSTTSELDIYSSRGLIDRTGV